MRYGDPTSTRATWVAAFGAVLFAALAVGLPRWPLALISVVAALASIVTWARVRGEHHRATGAWRDLVDAVDVAETSTSTPTAARLRRLRRELDGGDGTATWDLLAVREQLRRATDDPTLPESDQTALLGVRRAMRATSGVEPAGRPGALPTPIVLAGFAAATAALALPALTIGRWVETRADPVGEVEAAAPAATVTTTQPTTGVTVEIAPILVEAEITTDELEIPIVVRTPVTDATGWNTVPAPAFRSGSSPSTTVAPSPATTTTTAAASSTTSTTTGTELASSPSPVRPLTGDPLAVPSVPDEELAACVAFHTAVAGLADAFGELSPSVVASPWFVDRARACGDPTFLVDGAIAVGG